jgi:general stress protein YciG
MAAKKPMTAAEMGRKGGRAKVRKGLAALSAERRTEIARSGGKARWKKSAAPAKRVVMARLCPVGEADRSFDVEFWQRLGSDEIFKAAWGQVVLAAEMKGWRVPVDSNYADFLGLLNKHDARYLVIGGYAVMAYTEPRYTKDLDVWIGRDVENAKRVYAALVEFGAPLRAHRQKPEDLAAYGMIYQVGVAPVRIDVLSTVGALDFLACWARRKTSSMYGRQVHFLQIDDLIESKKRAGRAQDKLDLKVLAIAKDGKKAKGRKQGQ